MISASDPGYFVRLSALDAHQPVLDHVDAAEAMRAADLVHRLHQLHRAHGLPVDGDRDAGFEAYDHLHRLVGSILGIHCELVGVVRNRDPRILQLAALDGPAPQVLVDGVGVLLGERQLDAPARPGSP